MKASDLFVQCLENEGVEYIFGLPGEENADVMISLKESQKIKFILCRHEQAAAFMADVYGRLTGKAGVCLGTLGPGATNLVTGVADANMDRSPLVVITGQADTNRQHKESHQSMDVVGMYEPITKWNMQILHPDNIPEMVRKAFKVAETEKPGACHLEFPENIASMESNKLPISSPKMRRSSPDEKSLELAIQCIQAAKNPVILAGNGTVRTRSSKELRTFVQKTGLPVINTFMGKGAISRSDEHCLFTMGLQAKDHISCAMDRSDLVIAIGYDLVEYHPRLWNQGNEKKIIHIDFMPAEVDENYRVEVEIVADIANTLSQMTQIVASDKPLVDPKSYQNVRHSMMDEFNEYKDDQAEGRIKPQKILWDVREILGPEDILISDVGAHKMWIARYYQCDEPNTCLISNGFCSMGFAMPGAMVAKLIYPEKKVLAICGDGGALMNIQDLETAVRYQIPFVMMVWEDGGYGLIEWKQDNEFGSHSDLTFGNPDFVKLAQAFNAEGFRIEKSSEIKTVLMQAFECQKPAIISVPIDYRENKYLTQKMGKIICPI